MIEPIDAAVDHVRGPASAPLILEYGDYECPYSRQAYRSIQRLEAALNGELRFAFRHFPLTQIHPHAWAASRAAEAGALQDRFWEMHDVLFHRQHALEDEDLRGYARELGLDLDRFEDAWESDLVLERIRRDVRSGDAHLDTITVLQLPDSVAGCEDCLREGGVASPAYLPGVRARRLLR